MSVVAAVASALFKAYLNYGPQNEYLNQTLQLRDTAYASCTMCLSFLMVFRTQQAYGRFYAGTTFISQIMGSWFDATSSLFAFCVDCKDDEAVVQFQHTVVRIVSMCNAMIFAMLEGKSLDMECQSFTYELIDPEGFDHVSLKNIQHAENKVELLFQHMQRVTLEGVASGVLAVPPPILTRAFADMSGAMLKFHEALQLARVPFPFPYLCVGEALLMLHWIITPVVICFWTTASAWAAFFSFLLTFTLWSLNSIALELDNPFAESSNNIDGAAMQVDFNRRLVTLLEVARQPAPRLHKGAILDVCCLAQGVTPAATGQAIAKNSMKCVMSKRWSAVAYSEDRQEARSPADLVEAWKPSDDMLHSEPPPLFASTLLDPELAAKPTQSFGEPLRAPASARLDELMAEKLDHASQPYIPKQLLASKVSEQQRLPGEVEARWHTTEEGTPTGPLEASALSRPQVGEPLLVHRTFDDDVPPSGDLCTIQDAVADLGIKINDAVVTVPAHLNDSQREPERASIEVQIQAFLD